MFKFLTSKKGFTIVELMIVLVLLSLGVFAIGNMIRVASTSFDKSEERYLKQEAVKTVAETLRYGSNSVAPAVSADIFYDTDVVPNGDTVDDSYSYLYIEPHENEETGETDGYYLYVLNKENKRSNAILLCEVPMYVEFRAYESESYNGGPVENQCGAVITLAALEDDFDYSSGEKPRSDDIYYSLDVMYHFPNMVTNKSGVTVNYVNKNSISTANTYNENGKIDGTAYAVECLKDETLPKSSSNTPMVCSAEHCGCTKEPAGHYCMDCDCHCSKKTGSVLRVYCDSILSGDNTNTNVAVPKLCFIATASYGHDSAEVGMLCEFRDKCLLTNPIGSAFVDAYYKISPPIADFIAEHEGLKAAVRGALKPLIVVAEYSLNEEIAPQGIACFTVFMLCGLGITATLVRVDVRKRKSKTK